MSTLQELPAPAGGIVRLFGTPQFSWRSEDVAVPVKFFGLATLLASARDNKLPRNEIIAKLWGPPTSSRANSSFRQFLARMRKIEKRLAASIILQDVGSIAFNTTAINIDLKEVLQMDIAAAARRGDIGTLEQFITRSEMKLLEGIDIETADFGEWFASLEQRLRDEAIKAISAIFDSADPRVFSFDREKLACRLIELDPTQELGYRVLMEYYCQTGQRHLAHQTYKTCKTTLRSDFNCVPELATSQLAALLGLDGRFETLILSSADIQETVAESALARVRDDGEFIRIGTPRIMLLPPRLVDPSDALSDIATAFLDDISGGLTRYRSISVLAPYSGRIAAKQLGTDVGAISQTYGVDYLVTTLIKPTSQGRTASFVLINCRTQLTVTAADMVFNTNNLPDIFNQVSAEVVKSLVAAVEKSEIETPTATSNRYAYQMFLQGKHALWRTDLPDLRRARSRFQKSADSSDRFAPALAGIARTLSMERLVRGIADEELLIKALELAERAIRIDPLDGRGLRERGFASLYLRRHDESLRSFEAAATTNPHDADMLADFADALSHSGYPERALATCLRAEALNPTHPDYYKWIHASILYQLGKYEEAIGRLEPLRGNPATARLLAAANAMAGNGDIATHYAKVVRENYPDFQLRELIKLVPDKNTQDTKHLLEGLYRAGLR